MRTPPHTPRAESLGILMTKWMFCSRVLCPLSRLKERSRAEFTPCLPGCHIAHLGVKLVSHSQEQLFHCCLVPAKVLCVFDVILVQSADQLSARTGTLF